MIISLHVRQFKCFANLKLDLRPLTLFSGYNGSGKSSFVQPLLLLSQALRLHTGAGLPLNGPLARLGTVADIINGGAPAFQIEAANDTLTWNFTATAGERALVVQTAKAIIYADEQAVAFEWSGDVLPSKQITGMHLNNMETLGSLSELVMLSATRQGTLDVQPMPDAASPVRGDVGVEGQYASYWYDMLVDEVVDPSRRLIEEPGETMRMQVDAYLSRLFSGAQANITSIPQAASYALRYRIGDGGWRRPSNIGYGFTYAFPIIVALLAAKPGQVIIIDSPEAHLHPSAQSHMGSLLAKVAASGVQLLVETHSDHLLNGVRLAVMNQSIYPDEVGLHFFSGPKIDEHGVTSPRIEPEGRIIDWPTGFFDQSELDLARLAGWA